MNSYLYGCSPVWVRRWRVRLAERGKVLPQYRHEYLSAAATCGPTASPLLCAASLPAVAGPPPPGWCSTSTVAGGQLVVLVSTPAAGLKERMSGRLRRIGGRWKSGGRDVIGNAYSVRPALQFSQSIHWSINRVVAKSQAWQLLNACPKILALGKLLENLLVGKLLSKYAKIWS